MLKEAEQGKFQLCVHGRATSPMGLRLLEQYSKETPEVNHSRFHYDAYDRAMEQYVRAPSDASRLAAVCTMNDIIHTFVPQFPIVLELENTFGQPWVSGYRYSSFDTYYKYVDIERRLTGPVYYGNIHK